MLSAVATGVPVVVGEGLAAILGSSEPRIGSAGLSVVIPPPLWPEDGGPGRAGAGASAGGGLGMTCPIVVPVVESPATIAESGSPLAASTAVIPLIATTNPMIAMVAIGTSALGENMQRSTSREAIGEERMVLTSPSRCSRRAETPASMIRCSKAVSGVRTISLTLEPTVAPTIAPMSVP
jgi:hypothetical protein